MGENEDLKLKLSGIKCHIEEEAILVKKLSSFISLVSKEKIMHHLQTIELVYCFEKAEVFNLVF